jgi:hypothetical protein
MDLVAQSLHPVCTCVLSDVCCPLFFSCVMCHVMPSNLSSLSTFIWPLWFVVTCTPLSFYAWMSLKAHKIPVLAVAVYILKN